MLLRPRVIPCLTIEGNNLVKTIQFKKPRYIGDPINAVKIFNGKGVDELCILDISSTKDKREPNYKLLEEIASEAFVPLSYGGGITSVDQAKYIFSIGYEKIIINSSFYLNETLIKDIVKFAGSQSVVISIDVRKTSLGKYKCYYNSGTISSGLYVIEAIEKAFLLGAGEIIITSIDNDGKMQGYDYKLAELISNKINIPIILSGGAGNILDLKKALDLGVHAVSASSMFIYYGPLKAVLITYPSEAELKNAKIL